MRKNQNLIVQDIEVIDQPALFGEPLAPMITVVVPSPQHGIRRAFLAGAAAAMSVAAIAGLGWMLAEARDQQLSLQHELVTAEWTRNRQQRSMKAALAGLELAVTERNKRIAALEADRSVLEAEVATRRATTRRPHPQVAANTQAGAGNEAAAQEVAGAQQTGIETLDRVAEDGTSPDGSPVMSESPLRKALEASQRLASTTVEEPPTLQTIKAHIKAGDPLVATNKDAVKAEKSPLMRLVTNPIFIDSAMLGTSLLVPQSLPLTLAQSRLGRSLTRRSMRKAKLDKTPVGTVATDIGNMPITKKSSKKKR